MSSPLVSICIPCHNAVPYVGAALESALAQTWSNVEIIVVNDGSTDGSGEVLAEFESRGVKVIHERCGSAAKARNRALREAGGDYIKFFDADDLLSPEMVEKQMVRLKDRQDAVASSEWGRFRDDLTGFQPNPQSVWRDMEAAEWLVVAWADARPMMQPGMFLIPREILAEAGPWDEELTLTDDFEFYARLLCHATQVLFTSGATLYYRSGIAGSLSARKSPEAIESACHSLLKGTAHLLERRNDLAAKRSCANVLQDFIFTYYPNRPDLTAKMKARVRELGGSMLEPDGPPKYHLLRRWIGWRLAKRIQLLAGR